MELNIEDLKYLRGSKLDDGYRLVYKKIMVFILVAILKQ